MRRAVPRRRRLHRAAREEGLPRRDLRPGRGSAQGQGPRQARGRARRLAGHADRRGLSRRARAGVSDGGRARRRTPAARSGTIGVALLDLSTGEFTAAEYAGPDGLQALADELAVLKPREIVVPGSGDADGPTVASAVAGDRAPRACRSRRSTPGRSSTSRRAARCSTSSRTAASRASASTAIPPPSPPPARSSTTCGRRRRSTSRTSARSRYRQRADALLIDPTTLKHLEILEGSEGGRERIAARRARSHGDVDRQPAAPRVAAAAARRARADPRSARRGRGARVPHDRSRQVPRRDQGRPGPRAARRARGARHGRAARSRRAEAVARGRSARRGPCSPTCRRRSSDRSSPSSTTSRDVRGDIESTLVDEPPALARDGGFTRDGVDRGARRAASASAARASRSSRRWRSASGRAPASRR